MEYNVMLKNVDYMNWRDGSVVKSWAPSYRRVGKTGCS